MDISQQHVMDTLVQHTSPTSAWHEPIAAIVNATGLSTLEARRYVEGLEELGLVARRNNVADGPVYAATFGWARADEA